MTLVANSGTIGKNKNITVALTGFSYITCDNVEFLSIEKPEKSENESEEIQTNMRAIKDDVANMGWEDWSGLEIFNDSNGANWLAFVNEQEADSTGTVTISAGTNTIINLRAKVAKAGGGGGDASSFDTGFSPTFRFLTQPKTSPTNS